MKRAVLVYGFLGGLLIFVLRMIEYRFLVVEHSAGIYGGLIAAFFAGVGIWLGLTIKRKREVVVVREVAAPPASFEVNTAKLQELGITPRELEILHLIADGMSNREIATRLFVSENTVKTHSSRLFDKLGANRRTKAVHVAKSQGLIP